MPNLIGVAVLGLLLYLLKLLIGSADFGWVVFCIAYVLLAIHAFWFWGREERPKTVEECLIWVVGTIFLGAMSLTVDYFVGSQTHLEHSFWKTAEQAGGPFGFFATVVICPGMTMICLAGAARQAVAGDEDAGVGKNG